MVITLLCISYLYIYHVVYGILYRHTMTNTRKNDDNNTFLMSRISPEGNIKPINRSTWLFSCKYGDDQKKFEKFQRADSNISTFTIFVIISSIVEISSKGGALVNFPALLTTLAAVCGLVFEVGMGWIMLILFYMLRTIIRDKSDSKWDTFIIVFENVYVAGYNLSVILTQFMIVANGYCAAQNDYRQNMGCNSSNLHQLPEGIMALMLVFPMMLSMMVKSARSELIFLCWTLNFASLLFIFSVHNFDLSLGVFATFSLLSFVCLYEFQRHKISSFFLSQDLQGVKTENERLAEENRASELKHLIGNVAHDLKTPLSSLNMGIDVIQVVIEELRDALEGISGSIKDKVSQHIVSIEENLVNMKNVNSFMLMNINRCMDYTKASNGLKLVPKMETAPLVETLALPLHVMNAMHDGKTNIELLPVSSDIASHIITDKQWLQENILCLLSNAVKYSEKGRVTITVSVVQREKRQSMVLSQVTEVSTSPHAHHPVKQKSGSYKFKLWRTISYLPDKTTRELIERSDQSHDEDIVIFQQQQQSALVESQTTTAMSSPSRLSTKAMVYMLRVEVEDVGIGLSDEEMRSLFSPFKQTQRLAGGTGLGLFSLSRRIDAVNGYYGVQKRRDGTQGSLFWFEIPYKPDAEFASNLSHFSDRTLAAMNHNPYKRIMSSTQYTSGSTAKGSPSFTSLKRDNSTSTHLAPFSPSMSMSTDRKPLNILLADDTLSIQKMTCMLLRKCGHTVTVAENGAEALDFVTKAYKTRVENRKKGDMVLHSCYDVVLMDFQMPIMDGLQATRRIRKLETELKSNETEDLDVDNSSSSGRVMSSFHQLVIGLSANSDEETVQLAMDAGLDDFIEKPFKVAVFDEIFTRLQYKLGSAG